MDNIKNIDRTVSILFKEWTSEEKKRVVEYITKEQKINDSKGRFTYESNDKYKQAETFIDALSYNYFNSEVYKGKYNGRKLICGDCKHCKTEGCNKEVTCQIINNKNIKVFVKNDICKYFDDNIKILYDKSKYNSLEEYIRDNNQLLCGYTYEEWNKQKYHNFNDYLKFLEEEYYINYKGDSIVNNRWNYLYINDYKLEIYLNDWFDLKFLQSNIINYRTLYVLLRKKSKQLDTNNSLDLNTILNGEEV